MFKNENILNYTFTCCFVWTKSLVVLKVEYGLIGTENSIVGRLFGEVARGRKKVIIGSFISCTPQIRLLHYSLVNSGRVRNIGYAVFMG
jgi:hypothetical protein